MGIPMARIEFVDEMMARGFNIYDADANLPEKPHLFVEFHGSTSGVAEQAKTFGEIVDDMGGGSFQWTDQAEERTALWRLRHRAYYATKAHRPNAQVQTTDICVPISRLAEGVAWAREKAASYGLSVSMVGHVGDGNFHCGMNVTPGDEEERGRAAAFASELSELSLKLGGTITGEHGVGLGKMRYMEAEHGEALSVMAAIKTTLDPDNIMNPGKVVPLG